MAESYADYPPTRAAVLDLQEERRFVREGYDFLDEKRLQLAAEIMRELGEYRELRSGLVEAQRQANEAFAAALSRHGLEGLQVYPVRTLEQARLQQQRRGFLGIALQQTQLAGDSDAGPREDAPNPSPEARRCAERFARLLEQAAELAGLAGNLERLLQEYRRTERRARALEDVLLPEIEQALNELSGRLEELDLEDAVRVRIKRPAPGER